MIKELIQIFKSRLEQNNNELEVQTLGREIINMRCSFNSPASKDMIDLLKNEFSSEFPQDYIDFLECCNGATLYIHPQFGSENVIYTVQDVIDINTANKPFNKVVVACIYDDSIVIDLEKWRNGDSNYLLLCESMNNIEPSKKLYCNFEAWLERFILSQGNKYWYWSIER